MGRLEAVIGAFLLLAIYSHVAQDDLQLPSREETPVTRAEEEVRLPQEAANTTASSEEREIMTRLSTVSVANHGPLVITTVNHSHLKMTLNWVEALRRQGATVFVFCVDERMHEELRARRIFSAVIPSEWLPPYLREWRAQAFTRDEAVWGDGDYVTLTHFKAHVVWRLLELKYAVVFSDVDVAWIKPGALDTIQRVGAANPSAFLLVTTDGHDPQFEPPYVNSGMYLMRPSPEAFALLEFVIRHQDENRGSVDQHSFNIGLDRLGYKRGGQIQPLGTCLFLNGLQYFHRQGYDCPNDPVPHTAHADYMVGRGAKEAALRKVGAWYVSE